MTKDLMASKEAEVTPDGLWGGQWAYTQVSSDDDGRG